MKRPCLGPKRGEPCPFNALITKGSRCHPCERAHDRARGTTTQRGYGAAYQRARLGVLGLPCALRLDGCTGISDTAQHTDDGQLVPACAHCNYADGARRSRL